jgi:hypothetical protein
MNIDVSSAEWKRIVRRPRFFKKCRATEEEKEEV